MRSRPTVFAGLINERKRAYDARIVRWSRSWPDSQATRSPAGRVGRRRALHRDERAGRGRLRAWGPREGHGRELHRLRRHPVRREPAGGWTRAWRADRHGRPGSRVDDPGSRLATPGRAARHDTTTSNAASPGQHLMLVRTSTPATGAATEPGRVMVTPPTNVRVPPSQGVAFATPCAVVAGTGGATEAPAGPTGSSEGPLSRTAVVTPTAASTDAAPRRTLRGLNRSGRPASGAGPTGGAWRCGAGPVPTVSGPVSGWDGTAPPTHVGADAAGVGRAAA
jgi:hypothetical protein